MSSMIKKLGVFIFYASWIISYFYFINYIHEGKYITGVVMFSYSLSLLLWNIGLKYSEIIKKIEYSNKITYKKLLEIEHKIQGDEIQQKKEVV